MTTTDPLHQRFFARPLPVAWLVALRVLFGTAMTVSMLRFLAYGWIADFWIKPRFHFKYWGFGWVPELPPGAMIALFVALAALGLAIAAGAFFRVTSALFFLGFAYVQLIDVSTYLNHYYLASLVAALLAISPAHRAWSFDAWRSKSSITHAPAVWLTLFRFQIAVVYTFAGLAKMHGDWLLHAMPLRIWLASKTDMPILGALFAQEWAAPVMSWAGFLFDTSIAWFLMWRRTRLPAYGVVIVFHLLTRLLFPIGMFPVIMVMSALVFFPPDWPARLLRLKERAFRVPQPASPGVRRFALGAMAVFCALQVLLPLRFLVYGGDVRWHEQGMRFSWRVMVREKNGSVTFVVREKNSGKITHVAPRAYLTALQEREMSGQPDLILQLAHRIRDDYAKRGLGPVEVRAQADASLNGRPVAALVDPQVDLARVDDGLHKAHWILPLPPEDPPHLRPVPTQAIGRN